MVKLCRYIDSDITVRKPYQEWVSAEDGDIGLVLGVEALRAPDMYQPLQICQWAFGGKAGNPLLARMLDFISYRRASAHLLVHLQLWCAFQGQPLMIHVSATSECPCHTEASKHGQSVGWQLHLSKTFRVSFVA